MLFLQLVCVSWISHALPSHTWCFILSIRSNADAVRKKPCICCKKNPHTIINVVRLSVRGAKVQKVSMVPASHTAVGTHPHRSWTEWGSLNLPYTFTVALLSTFIAVSHTSRSAQARSPAIAARLLPDAVKIRAANGKTFTCCWLCRECTMMWLHRS